MHPWKLLNIIADYKSEFTYLKDKVAICLIKLGSCANSELLNIGRKKVKQIDHFLPNNINCDPCKRHRTALSCKSFTTCHYNAKSASL